MNCRPPSATWSSSVTCSAPPSRRLPTSWGVPRSPLQDCCCAGAATCASISRSSSETVMSIPPDTTSLPAAPSLEEILCAYLEAVDAGITPDREELLARHPERADELRRFFDDEEHLAPLVDPLKAPPPASAS